MASQSYIALYKINIYTFVCNMIIKVELYLICFSITADLKYLYCTLHKNNSTTPRLYLKHNEKSTRITCM